MAPRIVGQIVFALVVALPTSASADPYSFGPFYVRFDAGANAEDRKRVMELVGQSYGQLDDILVSLCATTSLASLGRSRQQSVRSGLIQAGVSDARIRIGNRCGKRHRHPAMIDAAKDAVVVIVGPNRS